MQLKRCTRLICLISGVLSGGCISVRTVNIGSKTSLEKQLMGELEPLSAAEALVAHVRAATQSGDPAADERQRAALAARQRQLFNRDDLQALRRQGCLGEGRDARLQPRPCPPARLAGPASPTPSASRSSAATAAAHAASAPTRTESTNAVALQALQGRLLSEENADRSTILAWAIASDPVLTGRDRAEVVALYRHIFQTAAPAGCWLQRDDGSWQRP